MSKSTKTAVRPVGKGGVKAATVTVAQVSESIAKAVGMFGDVKTLDANADAAQATLRRSEEAYRTFIALAVQAEAAGMTARAFGAAVGGNPNTRGRLVRVHAILTGKGGKRVPFWSAVALANTGGKTYADAVATLAAGGDPFADGKGKRPARPASDADKADKPSRKVQATTLTPDQYPAALALILANLDKIATDATRAKVADLARKIADAPALAPKAGKRAAKAA